MVGKLKVALALSGGAARGAFHLGAIEALEELGIEIGAISGTSIGSVIAVGFGSGLRPKEMLDIFKSKDFKKIIQFNNLQKGLLKINDKASILKKFAAVENIEDLKIPTFLTCVDLLSGEIVRFSHGKTIHLAIASSALMPLFKPVRYEDYLLIDGGFMDNLPLTPLKDLGLPIISVDLHPLLPSTERNFFKLYKRALFLSFISSSQSQIKESSLYITSPKLPSFGLFRFGQLDACFKLGYESAKERTLTFLSQKML